MEAEIDAFEDASLECTTSQRKRRGTMFAPFRYMWSTCRGAKNVVNRLLRRKRSGYRRKMRPGSRSRPTLIAETDDLEFTRNTNFPLAIAGPIADLNKQRLVTIGHRLWGGTNWWDGRGLLKVKLYDFAIYMDPVQVQSFLSEKPYWQRNGQLQETVQKELTSRQDVNMSIMLRASRDLPVKLILEEFEKILQRRAEKVGGSADDPALPEFLGSFTRAQALLGPSHSDSFPSGASITFSRLHGGTLISEAKGQVVAQLSSPKFCEALFDLYLGSNPVSEEARKSAGLTLSRMAEDSGSHAYVPSRSERVVCDGADLDACVLELL